jgi:hypothetical protein
MRSTVSSIGALIIISAIGGGCKPQQNLGSDEKSLENFASQSLLKTNACIGDPGELGTDSVNAIVAGIKGKRNAELDRAVREAVSAVPENLRDAFVALSGEVVLVDDTDLMCRPDEQLLATGGNDAKYEFSACYRYRPASTEAPRLLQIVMKPDATQIRHGLVRQFGYFYTERFRFFDFSVNGGQLVIKTEEKPNATIQAQIDATSDAFLYDLYASPFIGVDGLTKLIGSTAVEAIRKQVQANGNRILDNAGLAAEQSNRLKNAIFAEGFDSYYCSASAPVASEPFKELQTGEKFNSEKLKQVLDAVQNSRVIMGFLFNQSLTAFKNADALIFGAPMVPNDDTLSLTCGGLASQPSSFQSNFGGLLASRTTSSVAGAARQMDVTPKLGGLSGFSTPVKPSVETFRGTAGPGFASLVSSVNKPSTSYAAFAKPLPTTNAFVGKGVEPSVGRILTNTLPAASMPQAAMAKNSTQASAIAGSAARPQPAGATSATGSIGSLALNGPSSAAKCAVETVTGVAARNGDELGQAIGKTAAKSAPELVERSVQRAAALGDALNAAPTATALARPGRIGGAVGGVTPSPAKVTPPPQPAVRGLDSRTYDSLSDERTRNHWDQYYKIDGNSVAVRASKTDRVANIDQARRAAERIKEIDQRLIANNKLRTQQGVPVERYREIQPAENRLIYEKQRLMYEFQSAFPQSHPHYQDVAEAFNNRRF